MIQRTSNFIGLSSKAFYEGHSRKEALHECNAIPRPLLFPRKKASKNKLHSIFRLHSLLLGAQMTYF